MKKRRPTIKEIEDFAFEIHCEGLAKCMEAHDKLAGSDVNKWQAKAFKEISERIRKLIEPKGK